MISIHPPSKIWNNHFTITKTNLKKSLEPFVIIDNFIPNRDC